MPPQSSCVRKLQAPSKEDWKYLVDVARNTIAGIKIEIEREPSLGEGISEEGWRITSIKIERGERLPSLEEWHRSLLQTHATLEPALDGAKTSLILADAIVQNLEKIISTEIESLKPTPEIDEQFFKLAYIYRGVRLAAKQTAKLLMDKSSPDIENWMTRSRRSDNPLLGSDSWDAWQSSDPTDWVAVPAPETGPCDIVGTIRVAQGLYTTPSRFPGDAYDRWRMEVRYQNPCVVIYGAPITQPKTLKPVLDTLRSSKPDKEFSLIIIAEWVSGEVLDMLDSLSNRFFSYLVLSIPPYYLRARGRYYMSQIATFTGAKLLPEEELEVVGDTLLDYYELRAVMTIPFEPEKEPQVQLRDLGMNLQLVLSNRQRTLLVLEEDDWWLFEGEEKMRHWQQNLEREMRPWQRELMTEDRQRALMMEYPQRALEVRELWREVASWQPQTVPVLPIAIGPSESPQIWQLWQQQAAATIAAAAYGQQASYSGLVAGGGAALVWAQGKLEFTPPDGLYGKGPVKLDLVEKGWKAFKTALDAPLKAIADKAGSTVDLNPDDPVKDLVQGIQREDAPVYGYSLNKVGDGEGPSDYQLQPGNLSEERIVRHAVPASAAGLLVRNAAMIAQAVLNMWILGGNDERWF